MTASPRPAVLDLDGRALALLVAVHECGSVTGAAQRLGLSQSAVSHALERLRGVLGDALFVKSGRGIVPTARADALLPIARDLLAQLQRLAEPAVVEPARLSLTWTVAANDLQAGLLLPAWLDAVRAQAPGVRLRVIPSSVPTLELLRDEQCQLVISPRPPEGDDVVQKRLFADRYRVFFDAAGPAGAAAVPDRAAYEAAEHVSVEYGLSRRRLEIDHWLAGQGVRRRIVATVPAFAGLAAFLRGSARLATVPSLLGHELLAGLASAPLPFEAPELPMYAIWHRRHQHDALHRWLRGLLDAVVAEVIGAGAGSPEAGAVLSPRA